jgi:dTDP-D-glucose 4,6-dehydratase
MVQIHADADGGVPGSRYYVDAWDVADAVSFLLRAGTPGEKYNIVGEREVDNLEVARRIADAMGRRLKYELVNAARPGNRPGHDIRYAMSGEKMAAMGWTPSIPIEHAIPMITQWSLKNPQWLKVRS